MMKTAELREKYLAFFESKGCKRMPSSSLVPDDPSMLLTSAGMVQFKPYFLQQKHLEAPYLGATTVQKCVRTTDIDIIGTTGRHLSFFEMLGNFSFGAYFKEEMCAWAYEFSLDILGLEKEKIHITVYVDDDETKRIWENLGVEKDHITKLGKEDNFWVAGATGPSGPCSELYYDQGLEYGCGREDCAPGCDCDRYIEYWNLVFTQYDMQEDGSLVDLPKKNIDTGLGLERTAALLQGVHSNYETDILKGLIKVGERLSGKTYSHTFDHADTSLATKDSQGLSKDLSLRILADHTRAMTFMIGDGILPSNEGRGYVLRRLMRRAMRHGSLLGIASPFLAEFIAAVVAEMGDAYPEIVENRTLIEGVARSEEERFARTLQKGQGFLQEQLSALESGRSLDGEVAFELHDRFGFPIDLTIEIAAEQGIEVDRKGFDALMEQQRTQARMHAKDSAWLVGDEIYEQILQEQGPTSFLGYANTEATARVLALIVNGKSVTKLESGQTAELILDRTPFYAEKGGQVGDTGVIISDISEDQQTRGTFIVDDTKPRAEGVSVHVGHIEGTISVGSVVQAKVDTLRRERIERNHTATHLLQYALQSILGDHIKQAGSLVAPERLRFDFTHFEPVTPAQIEAIEQLVNELIMEDSTVEAVETSLDEARASGVTALFGERYGERVRVLSAGQRSRELCGGTHVSHTAEIGLFKILTESSVGANLRRIEAVTSFDALERYKLAEAQLVAAASLLKVTPFEVSDRIRALQKQLSHFEKELAQLKSADTTNELSMHLSKAVQIGGDTGYKLLVLRQDGLKGAELRETADFLRQKLGDSSAVVLGSVDKESAAILAAATKRAVEAGFDAGLIIRTAAPMIEGRGGGKASMAQAGGKNPKGLDAALAKAQDMVES